MLPQSPLDGRSWIVVFLMRTNPALLRCENLVGYQIEGLHRVLNLLDATSWTHIPFWRMVNSASPFIQRYVTLIRKHQDAAILLIYLCSRSPWERRQRSSTESQSVRSAACEAESSVMATQSLGQLQSPGLWALPHWYLWNPAMFVICLCIRYRETGRFWLSCLGLRGIRRLFSPPFCKNFRRGLIDRLDLSDLKTS